jgi:hypothetical protein
MLAAHQRNARRSLKEDRHQDSDAEREKLSGAAGGQDEPEPATGEEQPPNDRDCVAPGRGSEIRHRRLPDERAPG